MENIQHTYRNPWHEPGKAWYGPEFYTTGAEPKNYRGFQIFHRLAWELVKDGVCLTQMGGITGCKQLADNIIDGKTDFWTQRAISYLPDGRVAA